MPKVLGAFGTRTQAEEALAQFRTAAALAPDFPIPPNTLGALLQSMGRLEEAEAE